ncbi:hypothetical protein [Xanthomonas hortorum]|uniref:hypothetical protein n=1 Tax=Xanthomonas hortorum TaxID=56454 RepID=UPI002FE0D2DA
MGNVSVRAERADASACRRDAAQQKKQLTLIAWTVGQARQAPLLLPHARPVKGFAALRRASSNHQATPLKLFMKFNGDCS